MVADGPVSSRRDAMCATRSRMEPIKDRAQVSFNPDGGSGGDVMRSILSHAERLSEPA